MAQIVTAILPWPTSSNKSFKRTSIVINEWYQLFLNHIRYFTP